MITHLFFILVTGVNDDARGNGLVLLYLAVKEVMDLFLNFII